MRCLWNCWGHLVWLCSDNERYIYVYNTLCDSIQLAISPLSLAFWEARVSCVHILIPSSAFLVPTGLPQALAVASCNATSITVTLRDLAPDRINDRDGVTGFVVRRNRQRVAIVTDRTYTFNGLRPAGNYCILLKCWLWMIKIVPLRNMLLGWRLPQQVHRKITVMIIIKHNAASGWMCASVSMYTFFLVYNIVYMYIWLFVAN